jgi:hypothetical protein
MLNATTIIAIVKIVADIAMTLSSFLLLDDALSHLLPSRNTSDKRITLREVAGANSQKNGQQERGVNNVVAAFGP